MVRTLECPNCGGTVELSTSAPFNAVCIQCLTILDASTPALQILQKFRGTQRYQPLIPLGTRGKLPERRIRSDRLSGTANRGGWVEYSLGRVFALQPL